MPSVKSETAKTASVKATQTAKRNTRKREVIDTFLEKLVEGKLLGLKTPNEYKHPRIFKPSFLTVCTNHAKLL